MIEIRGVAVAALALALSACASAPEDIKPASIDSTQFAYLTCPQLTDWEEKLNAAYKTAADSEDSARRMDAVGLVTLGTPIGSMTHSYTPGQIADLKGRLAAVHSLESTKSCPQS